MDAIIPPSPYFKGNVFISRFFFLRYFSEIQMYVILNYDN